MEVVHMNSIKKLLLTSMALGVAFNINASSNPAYNATVNAKGGLGATQQATPRPTNPSALPIPRRTQTSTSSSTVTPSIPQAPTMNAQQPQTAAPKVMNSVTFPFFQSLEISEPNGAIGQFYPKLKAAFLQDSQGNVRYFINASPEAPAENVAPLFTNNFATTKLGAQDIPLHGIEIAQSVKDSISSWYTYFLEVGLPTIMTTPITGRSIDELYHTAAQKVATYLALTYLPKTPTGQTILPA